MFNKNETAIKGIQIMNNTNVDIQKANVLKAKTAYLKALDTKNTADLTLCKAGDARNLAKLLMCFNEDVATKSFTAYPGEMLVATREELDAGTKSKNVDYLYHKALGEYCEARDICDQLLGNYQVAEKALTLSS